MKMMLGMSCRGTCFDPEIPVNIVDLGLRYDLKLYEVDSGIDIKVKMTLTAPGCGMGPVIADDVKSKLSSLPKVLNVQVDLSMGTSLETNL